MASTLAPKREQRLKFFTIVFVDKDTNASLAKDLVINADKEIPLKKRREMLRAEAVRTINSLLKDDDRLEELLD